MSTAKHFTTDQNRQDETTIYWFETDGSEYGIAETGGTVDALDADGCPLPRGGRAGSSASRMRRH